MDNDKKHPLEELLGDKLIVKKSHANVGEEKKEREEDHGNEGNAESVIPLSSLLQNRKMKRIILYFSAQWCGPCRGFTPLLSAAYDAYKKKTNATAAEAGDKSAFASAETEVVFVSRDQDEKAFKDYFGKAMSFPALPYDGDRSRELMKKFGVRGIPTMVAIDAKTGEAMKTTADFRSLVGEYGANAFPLSPERISELEAARNAQMQQALKSLYDGNLTVVATESAQTGGSDTGVASYHKFSLKDLLHKNDHVGILLGDGDASDSCYGAASNALKKVKSKSNMNNRCAVVYVGWSLYNESSDHGKLNPQFDYYYDGGDGDGASSQEILKTIEKAFGGKAKAKAPQLMILRKGSGLCSIDGKCENEGVPVFVSLDPGLRKVVSSGAGAFPWDEAAMAAYEEAKKARIENLRLQLKGMRFLTNASDDGSDSSPPAVAVPNNGDGLSLKERLFVDGDKADDDAVIGLYFSASWCGPCVRTTPKLVECYEEVAAAGKKFEIVFVSSDSSQDDFEKYYKKMTTKSGGRQFLALDYCERELKNALSTLFGVQGIPTLVLLKTDGTVITVDGIGAVIGGGAESFPWDENTIGIGRTP